jgi:hypothetical protein
MIIKFKKTSWGWCARLFLPTHIEYTCFYAEFFCEPGKPIEKFSFHHPYQSVITTPDTYNFIV